MFFWGVLFAPAVAGFEDDEGEEEEEEECFCWRRSSVALMRALRASSSADWVEIVCFL